MKLLLSPGTNGGKEGPSVLNGSPQPEDEGPASLPGQQSGTVKAGSLRRVRVYIEVSQGFKSRLNKMLISNCPTIEFSRTATLPLQQPGYFRIS